MGLFSHGKHGTQDDAPVDENDDGVQRFFERYFEQLRIRGRQEFEKSIDQESDRFKKELHETIKKANSGLRAHLAKQLYEQFMESDDALRTSHNEALTTFDKHIEQIEAKYEELASELEKSITKQSGMFTRAFEANMERIKTMQDAQDAALRSLNRNVLALEEQHQRLSKTLEESVAKQESLLVEGFENNMAKIVEHYLLDALGEQYDVKTQLPAIIKQMEENKKAITDDMTT